MNSPTIEQNCTESVKVENKLWESFGFGDMESELGQFCRVRTSPQGSVNMATTGTACSTCAVGGCNTSTHGCK